MRIGKLEITTKKKIAETRKLLEELASLQLPEGININGRDLQIRKVYIWTVYSGNQKASREVSDALEKMHVREFYGLAIIHIDDTKRTTFRYDRQSIKGIREEAVNRIESYKKVLEDLDKYANEWIDSMNRGICYA